jgi:hypothetical protein
LHQQVSNLEVVGCTSTYDQDALGHAKRLPNEEVTGRDR